MQGKNYQLMTEFATSLNNNNNKKKQEQKSCNLSGLRPWARFSRIPETVRGRNIKIQI